MKSSSKRTVALLALLAVLCIGAAELTASYFCAPELFHRVTAPVVSAAQTGAAVTATAWRRTQTVFTECMDELSASVDALLASLERSAPPPQRADDSLYDTESEIADPAVTELHTTGLTDYLTGGVMNLVYYRQTDPSWTELPYGTDDIGRYGCGPTTMAMAISSMTDRMISPPEMASWAVQTGHWAKASGSYLSIVEDAAQAYGLTAYSIADHTPDEIISVLLDGDLIVALMGPGHFTSSGHFMIIHGVTLSGNLLVADPNSLERSLIEWDPQLIIDQLSKSTSNGAPLWRITAN